MLKLVNLRIFQNPPRDSPRIFQSRRRIGAILLLAFRARYARDRYLSESKLGHVGTWMLKMILRFGEANGFRAVISRSNPCSILGTCATLNEDGMHN